MRLLPLLLRHKRYILMNLDSVQESSSRSLASRIGPRLKRPASYAMAPFVSDESRSSKHAKLDTSTQPTSSKSSPAKAKDGSKHSRMSQRQRNTKLSRKNEPPLGNPLPGPLHDEAYIQGDHADIKVPKGGIPVDWKFNPKSALANFMMSRYGQRPEFSVQTGHLNGKQIQRASVIVVDDVVGIGDAGDRKEAERLAALSACYEILLKGYANKKNTNLDNAVSDRVELSDGSVVQYELARQFMDYYCRKFNFSQPFIDVDEHRSDKGITGWEAIMTVGGKRIGIGHARNKKDAQKNCYLDVTEYLENCDPQLWLDFKEAVKTGRDLGLAPSVIFNASGRLEDDIRDVCYRVKRSKLFQQRPEPNAVYLSDGPSTSNEDGYLWTHSRGVIEEKSKELVQRSQRRSTNPRLEQLRQTRHALPIYSKADDIVKHIEENEIIILMAATGSGKTTQVPQLILDHYIENNRGAECNIFCTQPRRIAAISVAHNVAKERGEPVGRGSSIGYQVRFESALPDENGSITFCTIGVFLRRMQNALQRGHDRIMDNVTHIVVDEVHERDIDTDLLLVVIKRLMERRKAKGKPVKIILMSATIDSTLFENYFSDSRGNPAKVIEVHGRSYPVQRHFLDDFLPVLVTKYRNADWVFKDEKVVKYVATELPGALRLLPSTQVQANFLRSDGRDREEDLEIPYPLVALTISHVLQTSDSGHVLAFLPGWDEIQAVERILTDFSSSLGIKFNDREKYSIHVLHSTIPLAEQQVIFDPPPEGVRRIILATNIAETSITIPDVVYVIDTGKVKESRYDPDRHISSLVSAWVGRSNLNQRAGRAGRHRPGEYYGILSRQREGQLHSHQTVEMKRSDLSSVVMHVKALDFPNMRIEEVLNATIEPPEPSRVAAAMGSLEMVGALDRKQRLTALGRVLLQLPIEAQIGRLVLYGCIFKCLDQALTLAAILTNRDPFLSPPLKKKEAQAAKDKWCPEEFRSDALTVLNAYNAWYEYEKKGNYSAATGFCSDNFLSKSTLLTIAKIKTHLLHSLYNAGILDVSASGALVTQPTNAMSIPTQLNENGKSLPLLAALIAMACQPKFAVRTGPMLFRTAREKNTAIHPASVNHRKRLGDEEPTVGERQIFAFSEKRQNLSMAGQGPGQMYLVQCTRLDPMTYMLFGAHNLLASKSGLECDEWLPITGNLDVLDDIRRLKLLVEGCMLRVFEGMFINMKSQRMSRQSGIYVPPNARQNHAPAYEDELEIDDGRGALLSTAELKDVDELTRGIVQVLDDYAEERRVSQSRRNSRPATPMAPSMWPGSGTSTPRRYDSRPHSPNW